MSCKYGEAHLKTDPAESPTRAEASPIATADLFESNECWQVSTAPLTN